MHRVWSLLAAALLVAGAAASLSPKVYLFGDIHYDPYYGTAKGYGDCTDSSAPTYSQANCDTPTALLHSAMNDIGNQYAQDGEGLVLMTGDFVRHKMANFANVTLETDIVGEIINAVGQVIDQYLLGTGRQKGRHYPDLLVHPSLMAVLGNDDCIPDYGFNDNVSVAHPTVAVIAEAFANRSILTPTEAQTFRQCAFFSRQLPNKLTVISINTIMYSVEHVPIGQNSIADPCGQFAWIKSQLAQARSRGDAVYIIGHIIPESTKWSAQYLESYKQIAIANADVIAAQWFGHTHMFTFMAMTEDDASPPLFDVPAITPRDGNRPSYLRVSTKSYNGSSMWTVDEIHLRYLTSDTHDWTDGMQFMHEFGLAKPVTSSQLHWLAVTLAESSKHSDIWETFETMYFGGEVPEPMGHSDKTKVCCKQMTMSESGYESCKNTYGSSSSGSSNTAFRAASGTVVNRNRGPLRRLRR